MTEIGEDEGKAEGDQEWRWVAGDAEPRCDFKFRRHDVVDREARPDRRKFIIALVAWLGLALRLPKKEIPVPTFH